MPAPTITSAIQCLLFNMRLTPVAVATVYPPMLIHGLICPYSLCSIVAHINAVAVCPDGKERLFEPSGRFSFTVCFSVFTTLAIKAIEKASDTAILPHELRPSTPRAFIPSITAAGEYWRKSS